MDVSSGQKGLGSKSNKEIRIRNLRKDILDVFFSVGGIDRLVQWARDDANYEKFIFKVLIPLLPKQVNEDLYEKRSEFLKRKPDQTPSGHPIPRFDRNEFNAYLKEAGDEPEGSTENDAAIA
jgi:hypothetical protein